MSRQSSRRPGPATDSPARSRKQAPAPSLERRRGFVVSATSRPGVGGRGPLQEQHGHLHRLGMMGLHVAGEVGIGAEIRRRQMRGRGASHVEGQNEKDCDQDPREQGQVTERGRWRAWGLRLADGYTPHVCGLSRAVHRLRGLTAPGGVESRERTVSSGAY